jgi:hypothetical protein
MIIQRSQAGLATRLPEGLPMGRVILTIVLVALGAIVGAKNGPRFVLTTAPIARGPVTLKSVTLDPSTVAGGASSTGTVTLSGPAPAGGFTASLSSNSPCAKVPGKVTVNAGADSATFSIDTVPPSADLTATIDATYSTAKVSAGLTIIPVVPKSLAISPTSVIGGTVATGVITLKEPPPSGVATASLVSSSAFAKPPASVAVAAGATMAKFSIATVPVSNSGKATIKATLNGVSVTATLDVTTPAVKSLTLAPTAVVGGVSSQATVTLTGPAPTGGSAVALTSGNKVAQVQARLVVPAGATSASVPVTTIPTATNATALIKATLGGESATATLTVDAPKPLSLVLNPSELVGGNPSTALLTLTGAAPAGGFEATLTSSNPKVAHVPAKISVPAGETHVSFTVTTSVTKVSTTASISAKAVTTVSARLTVYYNYYFNYPTFTNRDGLTLNGDAFVSSPTITMVLPQVDQLSSMFYNSLMDVSGFTTEFEFSTQQANADGITFCITTAGVHSLGQGGGGIGYVGIDNSMCIKWDLYANVSDDANSTGIFTNGEYPYDPSIPLAPVLLDSGDTMKVNIKYSGTTLTVVTSDEVTGQSSTQTYTIDIPGTIGNKLAYVGFTSATGSFHSLTQLYSWNFLGGL